MFRPQYHGSIQVMRHATELHEPIDVVATADASLIPMLMYAMNDPDTGQPYANWYIRFASNHLALAYNPTANMRMRSMPTTGMRSWPARMSRWVSPTHASMPPATAP